MGRKKISSSDLIWLFHQRLKDYEDHPFHGISLAVIPTGKGGWDVITPQRLPKREPDLGIRVSAIAKQLKKLYTLAND